MKRLRVAFVGMKRPPSDIPVGYWSSFVRYHLELPWYYARFSACDIDLTTVEPVEYHEEWPDGGSIRAITESQFLDQGFDEKSEPYDVIVHWRKWFDDLYVPGARNVILSQDHSYGDGWKTDVKNAFAIGRLEGILVFPTWHQENTARELGGILPQDRLYTGMTLGVDTEIYFPAKKDPYHLLWASDPGRGLDALIVPFMKLWQKDQKFRLSVTYPDYVKPETLARFAPFFQHPGVRHYPGLRNGPTLWTLFNEAGVLPYSSTFPEPSSRCHRQAQAAGCLVLYPPNMGTPSHLIEHNLTGIVEDIGLWPDIIRSAIASGRRDEIGHNARVFALSENWAVQAQRFYRFFGGAE